MPEAAPAATRGAVALIARKELLDHLLSLKFHVSMGVMAVLLGLSAYVMHGDYQLRTQTFAVLKEQAKPRPGEYGVVAVIEPNPLSVFAKGLDELMTRGYSITSYTGVEPRTRQTAPASLFTLFAAPDLLYIVKTLLSLIALLFAYDAVSGEKEAGTLKLVLSSSISRGQLVAGKMLGGLAAVLLPFLMVLSAILAVLVTLPGIGFSRDAWARMGIMVLAAVLYVALFFCLGTLVSAYARTSAGALMTLLFLWAAIVFAIPNLGNLAAEQLRPVPSAQTQEMTRLQEFAKNRFLEIQGGGRDRAARIADFNRAYDRLLEDHRSRLDAMVGLSKSICRISPAATLTYVFTDLAGTGLNDHRRLNGALLAYKSRMVTVLDTQGGRDTAVFEFRRMGLAEAFQRGALIDFAVLALTCAGLFTLAVFAFLRVDPR